MINKTQYKDLNAMEKSKFNQIDTILPIDVVSRYKVISALLNKYFPSEDKINYKEAFNILIENFDLFSEEDKKDIDKRLREINL